MAKRIQIHALRSEHRQHLLGSEAADGVTDGSRLVVNLNTGATTDFGLVELPLALL
ncbi:MAG: hypothetical protein ACLU9S_19630 [Oscillospiraceae bacterium]